MRRSGILLHITSLPSPYGIGTFGKAAYDFVDFLYETKQSLWQILPLGPTSYGDSPYQTFSAFANNPYFIDLEMLVQEKLLKRNEILSSETNPNQVDYEAVYQKRFLILKKAFKRFDINHRGYQQFLKDHARWLNDYALFMAIKEAKGGASWLEWEEPLRLRNQKILKQYQRQLKETIEFQKFIQFKAFEQWLLVKEYANKKQIEIIGDMPIYVALDSSDVWANPQFFQLNDDKIPYAVAGVPPDNYSEDGQLWGNPLYHWEHLKETGYQWWIDRIKSSEVLFDWVRIDHFIGFQNYYSIPYGDKNAKLGEWKKGPGLDLFKHINKKIKTLKIIAEDLGVVTPDVVELLKQTGFPGMKLLQFAFDPREESTFIPYLYPRHSIVYTGTHDNQTTKSWFESLAKEDLEFCLNYINHQKGSPVDSLVKATLASVSDVAIIPMQDYLRLGDEGRMNTPSTLGNNWKWRLVNKQITKSLKERIAYQTSIYGRAVK